METKNNEKRTKSNYSTNIDYVEDIPRPIVAVALDYPSNQCLPLHKHQSAQLLYASKGIMTVTTRSGIWVVPPERAVWIPKQEDHEINTYGQLSMRTLYIKSEVVEVFPKDCCVVTISPLLKLLIQHATTLPKYYDLEGSDARIMSVILDQIESLPVTPLDLKVPHDSRLQGIYQALVINPSDNRSLKEWGKKVGACSRTLTRLFQSETSMNFRQWRQQFRLLEALKRLGQQDPVTNIAIDLGYNSTSAFINMFKKALGKTPGQYFNQS